MKRPIPHRAGFTLIEIMVALIAGIVTISIVYSLGNGSSRVLAEQSRLASTQTSVRLAMDQIRADIERAGLFGSPNNDTGVENSCSTPPFRVQAIEFRNNADEANVPNAALHRVEADRLILMGNYLTSGAYMIGTLSDAAGGGTGTPGGGLDLQTSWQSFRRDFVTNNAGVETVDANEFARVFANNRMLHVMTLQGRHFYTRVSGRNVSIGTPLEAVIDIAPAFSPGGVCTVGLMGGATVAPIQRIEYAIVNPRDANSGIQGLTGLRSGGATPETTATRDAIEGIPSVLVRREIDEAGTPIPGTTRVVLEFAVEFDLRFDVDTTSGPGTLPTISTIEGAAAATTLGTGAAADPQQVRAVHVRLSARTPEAAPNMPWYPRANGRPLTRYFARAADANPANLPSSRVRTMTTTVFVPNVAYADSP